MPRSRKPRMTSSPCAHSGLGLIDIDHQKFEDARTELMQAVQLASSPDPVDYFLLGNADVARPAISMTPSPPIDKCAASGPLVAQCKAREDVGQDMTPPQSWAGKSAEGHGRQRDRGVGDGSRTSSSAILAGWSRR